MPQKKELLFFLFCGLLNINSATPKRNNKNWPEDNTTPFPYPTPGPINLKTSTARFIETPTPLTYDSHKTRKSIATNSGKDLVIKPLGTEKNEHALITGGILYEDVHKWFQTEFFWDLDLDSDAADGLDGKKSQVEVAISYWNTKYDSKKDAINYRDGISQVVIFVYVKKNDKPNEDLNRFIRELGPIKEANSSTQIPEHLSFLWYHQNSTTDDYYAYPGMYLNPETGKIHYCSTVIILVRTPPFSMSHSQFNELFRSLKNEENESYSHKLKALAQGKRPVVHSKGFVSGRVKQSK